MKLIIFDLDGVLVDIKEVHYQTLNQALREVDLKYEITLEEHLSKYDGLKTNQKLELLSKEKDLPPNLHQQIWDRKQALTILSLKNLTPNKELVQALAELKKDNYKLACCSNSIRNTIYVVLHRLEILDCFDLILSNQDVSSSKPYPEIYWEAMSRMKVLPEETLIVEDSPPGLFAAYKSGAHILRVKNSGEVSYSNIKEAIKNTPPQQPPKWQDKKLNILIPMAGAGSRFQQVGYQLPKPLIDVDGKPMIQTVVENLNMDAHFIFVVQKIHRDQYSLDILLKTIVPNCSIVEADGLTEGAACTALLAKDLINNDNPLFFANSDQNVEWNPLEFMYKMQESNMDGGIVVFKDSHPKWSFAKIDESTKLVVEVAEKNPISDNATVGYYFWKKGSDFVKYAELMMQKNIRVNNEFYVCPVFNQAIEDGKKIITFEAKKMWGLGTPEDLEFFLKNRKR